MKKIEYKLDIDPAFKRSSRRKEDTYQKGEKSSG
jgi:hypothetical protein